VTFPSQHGHGGSCREWELHSGARKAGSAGQHPAFTRKLQTGELGSAALSAGTPPGSEQGPVNWRLFREIPADINQLPAMRTNEVLWDTQTL